MNYLDKKLGNLDFVNIAAEELIKSNFKQAISLEEAIKRLGGIQKMLKRYVRGVIGGGTKTRLKVLNGLKIKWEVNYITISVLEPEKPDNGAKLNIKKLRKGY